MVDLSKLDLSDGKVAEVYLLKSVFPSGRYDYVTYRIAADPKDASCFYAFGDDGEWSVNTFFLSDVTPDDLTDVFPSLRELLDRKDSIVADMAKIFAVCEDSGLAVDVTGPCGSEKPAFIVGDPSWDWKKDMRYVGFVPYEFCNGSVEGSPLTPEAKQALHLADE